MTLGPFGFGPGGGYISHVKNVAMIPTTPHWVVLTEDTVSTWSGYKEDAGSTETVMRYHAFEDEARWKSVILKLEEENLKGPQRRKYIAFHVDRRASTQIEIKVT